MFHWKQHEGVIYTAVGEYVGVIWKVDDEIGYVVRQIITVDGTVIDAKIKCGGLAADVDTAKQKCESTINKYLPSRTAAKLVVGK